MPDVDVKSKTWRSRIAESIDKGIKGIRTWTGDTARKGIEMLKTGRDGVISGIKWTGSKIYKGAENTISYIRNGYDNFHQTIAEGNYHIKPKSLWTLITGQGREADLSAPTTFAAAAMLDTGRSFGKRMMWASAIALFSMNAMVWAVGGLALAGVAMFVLEYSQSRRARNETITEVNFAGQTVEGSRADLYHLHQAQEQIMNLSSAFKQASMDSTNDTIHRIMDSVAERSKRVKVLQSGRYEAGTLCYEFSEPAIKLVKARPASRQYVVLNDDGDKDAIDAKPAAAVDADEIARRFLALEEALPSDALAKVEAARRERQSAPAPVPVPVPMPAPAPRPMTRAA